MLHAFGSDFCTGINLIYFLETAAPLLFVICHVCFDLGIDAPRSLCIMNEAQLLEMYVVVDMQ